MTAFSRAHIVQNSRRLKDMRARSTKSDAQLKEEIENEDDDSRVPQKPNWMYVDPTRHMLLQKYVDVATVAWNLAYGVFEPYFNGFMMLVVVLASLLVGVQTYPQYESDANLEKVNLFIFITFVAEAAIKIVAEGLNPINYFISKTEGAWNSFDFAIVFLCAPYTESSASSKALRMLSRLARVFRISKIIRQNPALQVIYNGLMSGLAAVSFIALLLVLVFYLFAVIGVYFFRENNPFYFRTVGIAIITLYHAATLENWGTNLSIDMFGCNRQNGGFYYSPGSLSPEEWNDLPSWQRCTAPKGRGAFAAFYWVSFIVIAALIVLALFVGVITMSMQEALLLMKIKIEEV